MHTPKQNLKLAVYVCLIACFFIAAMGACSKLVSNQISIYTILFFQNAIGLVLITPRIVKKGWTSLKTEKLGLHLARALFGLLMLFFLFTALKTIPLVDGTLLNTTAPLWIPIIAFFGLRIRKQGYVWWGVIVGFIGTVFILKPGAEALSIGSVLALASGLCAGITFLIVRKLTFTEPTYRILFYYFLVGVIITAPFTLLNFSMPSLVHFMYLLGVGVFCFLGQLLLTYSFQKGKVSVLAPITYATIIYSGIFDWLIWNHLPTILTYVGVILIVVGAMLALYFENKYQKQLVLKQ